MSANDSRLVIIGSGTSGYTVARQVRALQKERPITVITADGGEVYSKPMLSNALAKGQTPQKLVQKAVEQKAAELKCEVLTRCFVSAIDPGTRTLETSGGAIRYEQLVLAIGAHQRVFLPQGADPSWIQMVNSLEDFRAWYPQLEDIDQILLIGAGLISCEFADDLMSHGIEVQLVDPAPWPLARLLPEALGETLAEALEQRGARLFMRRTVASLEKAEDGRFVATLDNGTKLTADRVLSATGLVPQTQLAKSAGLDCRLGIVVDRQLRSSDPHIFALGDCAETPAGYLPFIQPIMHQARYLAEVLAGRDAALALKAMPVIVKTTSLPVVVCPPHNGAIGTWTVSGEGRDLVAVCSNGAGNSLGFAVTGAALGQQTELAQRMPPLISN